MGRSAGRGRAQPRPRLSLRSGPAAGPPRSAVRRGDWKLILDRRKDRIELFNLADDPFEENDLADEQPERAARLLGLLKTMAEQDG